MTLEVDVSQQNSVRLAGEDIKKGSTLLSRGTQLSADKLALVASAGLAEVPCFRLAKVAIIVTGDELIEAGETLQNGQIYESNRFALHGLLQAHPVEIQHFGIIPDKLNELERALKLASEWADVILTCGGVSVGDADFVKQVLETIGQIDFWKVAIKPGKPFAFGKIGKAVFCGLPGNPVSSYVTFEQLVSPMLDALLCKQQSPTPLLNAIADGPIYKRPGRADFQRGICFQDEQGEFHVKPNGKQGSGIMTSIANANCYIVLPIEAGNVSVGQKVKIQLF